jgi:hypothetical protein
LQGTACNRGQQARPVLAHVVDIAFFCEMRCCTCFAAVAPGALSVAAFML